MVEDDPGDAVLMRALLQDQDVPGGEAPRFEISRVDRVEAALPALEHGRFDVVLLDLCLPDGRGVDVVRKIKTAAGDLPIVVMGAGDDEPLAVQTLQEGAQDYLMKRRVDGPLVRRVLLNAIRRKRGEERGQEREERPRGGTGGKDWSGRRELSRLDGQ
jgi:DNA-binding response OmpR family regulator